MHLYCSCCGRDLNAIYQDNISDNPHKPLCEDCSGLTYQTTIKEWEDSVEYSNQFKYLSKKQFKFLMRYAGWSYFRIKNTPHKRAIKKIEQIIFMRKQKSVSLDKS